MKNEYSIKDKLILCLLATGAFCFGVLLPDSFSDHDKLVHFSAHFGMSCLLALCFYIIFTVKMRISKSIAYMILIMSTLIIGIVYKFWEIGTSGMTGNYSFHTILNTKGVATSMSQNISGLLGGIFLIEGLVDKNLVMSVPKNASAQNEKSFSLSSGN
jgi:hypothetical protein